MPLGMKKDITFLFLPPFLLPHTCSHTHRHTPRQLNKILEAPDFQVYFGVGGDYSLRLHPPFPAPKMFLIYEHSQPFGWEEGGDSSPTPEIS